MSRRWLALFGLMALLGGLAGAQETRAQEVGRYSPASRGGRPWVAEVLEERALAHDIRPGLLTRLAVCEAGPALNPRAVGAAGELGIVQLHPRGLLPLFRRLGYSDPFNVWEAADFAAWAFAHGLAPHWACYPLVRFR